MDRKEHHSALASEVEAAAYHTFVDKDSHLEQPVFVEDHQPFVDDNLPSADLQVLFALAFHLHSNSVGTALQLLGAANAALVVPADLLVAAAELAAHLELLTRQSAGVHPRQTPLVALPAAVVCAEVEGVSAREARVAPFQDILQGSAWLQTVDSSYASYLLGAAGVRHNSKQNQQ